MVALPTFTGTVELRPTFAPRPQISHVVFDFDGTLSWIRHGWPAIMLDGFRRRLPSAPGDTEQSVRDLLLGVILGLNGKPTILQMVRFAEIVRERGGPSLDPEMLRREYQDQLDAEIAARAQLIRSGRAKPDDFVVHGARLLLAKLQREGLTPIILSSTIEERVKEEAEILQLTPFFGHRINGGTGDPAKFSKLAIYRRILSEENIAGENLLSFGDGPAEILATKELGGLAIAVCSDEDHNGSGVMEEFKRGQLLTAGADAAVPDFRDAIALLDYLLGR
ncbi:MAG: HAD family hydrolase [Verrucomicrobia bacterium]|nr:HAD family hydrolase [Verrucomicrobiota bacterium]